MISLISNNPFRVLGVYSNSPTKDIIANVNKAKAYLNVGRILEFPSDFKSILPSIQRTIETINLAQAQINKPNDKIKYALFWFVNGSSFDDIALGHLNANNIAKAKELFKKRSSFSSLQNLGVISLCENDLKAAISNYSTLIHDSRLRSDFINAVCGTSVIITEDDLTHTFFDSILVYYTPTEVLSSLDSSNIVDFNYVYQQAISIPSDLINSEIAISKNAGKGAAEQYEAGIELMGNTKQSLLQLKQLIGNEEQYQIIADKLAKQILQLGINYYNSSSDSDKVHKALVLQQYALNIAVGKLTKDRCKSNVAILNEVIESLPPHNITSEANELVNILSNYKGRYGNNINDAISLIYNAGPLLASIRKVQGNNGKYYRHISTEIEETALDTTISIVNATLKRVEDASSSSTFRRLMALDDLKSALKKAWEATLCMDVLDIESEAKERLNTQRQTLSNLLKQAGVLQSLIYSDFKLETEEEIFNSCRTRSEYKSYLQRFPNGKFINEAQNKVKEFERKEEEEKQQLLSTINNTNSFSEAISLYSKCQKFKIIDILDDKCFSLCKSNSNFKKYIETFGTKAKHANEAEKHLVFERKLEKFFRLFSKNKGWFIFIAIIIVVFVAIGLIWGTSGYLAALKIIGFISIFLAIGGIGTKENAGCVIALISGLIAAICFIAVNSIEDHLKEEKRIQEEKVDYDNLKSNPTEKDITTFLYRYPKSNHTDDVLKLYYNIAQEEGLKSLDKLAKDFSSTDWGKIASLRVKQICDSLYQIANNTQTVQGWKEYQASVPSEYYADSNAKIETIENEAWSTEAKAWNQAIKENSISAFQKYLNLYPNGSHSSAADKKLIDLQVANVHAGEHGELPPMDRTGYGGGSSTTIEIENNTSYILTLLYSGPESKRVVIAPQSTRTVLLKNGYYRIAASVSASGVRSFAGSENLNGGSYSVEYYIVTTRY